MQGICIFRTEKSWKTLELRSQLCYWFLSGLNTEDRWMCSKTHFWVWSQTSSEDSQHVILLCL